MSGAQTGAKSGDGSGDPAGGPLEALLGAADIARLTGVQRPAVSNWRRRHSDFPRPMAGSSANPLFSLAEVEQWCRRNGKPFRADTAERLWQRIQAVVQGMRTADFLAHTGLLLTGHNGAGPVVEQADERWDGLLREIGEATATHPGGAVDLYMRLSDRFAAAQGRSVSVDAPTATAMAELAGVRPGMRVLDPACGGGVLLRAAATRGADVLWGQDLDPALAVIARSRLLLAGKKCEVTAGDSLRRDGFTDRQADAVLCDPPFRDRHWGHDELDGDARWTYGYPPRGEGELAWVQHCLARVRPGGAVVVRMPTAAADRASGRRVRAALLATGALRMVAELPGGDGPPAAHLWVLRRPEAGSGAADRLIVVHGAKSHAEIVSVRPEPVVGTSAATAVPVADLLGSAVDLRPSAHAIRATAGGTAEYPALRAELIATLAALAELPPELEATRAAPAAGAESGDDAPTVGELAASGLVEIHHAPLGTPVDRGNLPLLTHKDLREQRPPSGRTRAVPGGVAIRPGDVLAASGGHPPRPRIAGEDDTGALLGPRLLLLRADPARLDPGYLAGVVEGAAMAAERADSSAALRFDPRKTRVPMISLVRQHAYAEMLRRLDMTEEQLTALADLGRRLADLGRLGLSTRTLLPPTSEEAPR
ncbi:N-6 DNA methylase [Nocardiopsis sediminis]|uniref:N-6 DNA methylase n=1 Tax=Nocardiopsis sediminis TaxID=1778267 RepID=A0ABV8FIE5_9ACTN